MSACKKPSQLEIVRRHFRRAKTINSDTALKFYGLRRVEEVIHRLRKAGMDINTERYAVKGARKTRYRKV